MKATIKDADGYELRIEWGALVPRGVVDIRPQQAGGSVLDLAGIAALREALDKAELAYRVRTKKQNSLIIVTNVRVPPEAMEPAPTNMGDIACAVAWVHARRAEGKRRMLVVFRNLRELDESPNARHPDNDTFIAAMGADTEGDWYCMTTRHLGFMDAATDAVYCCDGVTIAEANHLTRLAPTWTADGLVTIENSKATPTEAQRDAIEIQDIPYKRQTEGERIRALRRARGLTLEDTANAMGTSIPYASSIERGKATPTEAQRDALAKLFGTGVYAKQGT